MDLGDLIFLITALRVLPYVKNSDSQNHKKKSRLEETSGDHIVQPSVESRL